MVAGNYSRSYVPHLQVLGAPSSSPRLNWIVVLSGSFETENSSRRLYLPFCCWQTIKAPSLPFFSDKYPLQLTVAKERRFSRAPFLLVLGTLDANSTARRQDVDNDFFLLFSVIDENLSWHIDENIVAYCSDPASVDKEDKAFQESNRMHGELEEADTRWQWTLMEGLHWA